ncbi:hypothetical protein GGI04_003313 [Coemansia thaxteri]|uniref:Uncharacterized protein n=1 Tax=Coemansia thaxteri TaxID=2663907 RepID=A0A9W8EJW8_9FUNG|nr:hypothetical protein GGI04_003313 [Coemansia thaxteri]KAJ2004126.1 hypothetical protein H4R26_002684 [Coemansia thaxteri]KAJ2467920.1 hypothetical protein GGI02_003860 [Coemansia sp. RSA 2322]KAJ2485986.1 hypothetical protein EV174_001400 [Coemansia sp. RSA 2320]
MEGTEAVDDIHGFFQFANDSDSDGDDGLFAKPKQRAAEFDASKIEYTPRMDEDGWFDRSHALSVAEWLEMRTGLEELTFTTQRLYFKKEYSRAADLCRQAVPLYVDKNSSNLRVASIRELLEIGAKSAMKVDDLENVEFFYGWYVQCGGNNPGYNYFQAEALTKLGRLDQALDQYIRYLEQRRHDAQIWELIGGLLVAIGEKRMCKNVPQVLWWRLALGALVFSHWIALPNKGWRSDELAERRRQAHATRLISQAVNVLDKVEPNAASLARCGSMREDAIWQKCKAESTLDELGQQLLLHECAEPLATSIKWVISRLSLGSQDGGVLDGDDDDDEDRNVAEL